MTSNCAPVDSTGLLAKYCHVVEASDYWSAHTDAERHATFQADLLSLFGLNGQFSKRLPTDDQPLHVHR
jgi:hypothetical protein